MIFSDTKLIESMNETPESAIVDIIDIAHKLVNEELSKNKKWSKSEYNILIETIALIGALIESNGFDAKLFVSTLSGNAQQDCQKMLEYINGIKHAFFVKAEKIKIEQYKNQYKSVLKSSFAYEFSQDDIDRIQTLINEIRKHITGMDNLSDDHKTRLLKRLEKLQSELHKRLSDLDKFWGIVIDAGVILNKLGKSATKPIVDGIKEISQIVWSAQTRAEGLPSNSAYPLLNDDDT